MLFVLSTSHKVLANSLAFQRRLIHTYLQSVPHFDSLFLSTTFLCNFIFVFALAGKTCTHVSLIVFVFLYQVLWRILPFFF